MLAHRLALRAAGVAIRSRRPFVWAIASLEDVQEGMARVGYPQGLIRYHKGRAEDTIPEKAPDRIALLRLDTAWYKSARHELEHSMTGWRPAES